jgi:hypothetical protein
MAQIPSLPVDAGQRHLPITEESFLELCSRFLDPKSLKILLELSLEPPKNPKKTGSVAVDSWNEMENNLRLALAQVRSQKLKKNFEVPPVSIRPEAIQAARTAMSFDSPLEAEQFLNQFRKDFVDCLAKPDIFSTESLYVYALRLKLAHRIQKFDEEAGIASYHKIYDRILGEAK